MIVEVKHFYIILNNFHLLSVQNIYIASVNYMVVVEKEYSHPLNSNYLFCCFQFPTAPSNLILLIHLRWGKKQTNCPKKGFEPYGSERHRCCDKIKYLI